jgi:hypothetical protein
MLDQYNTVCDVCVCLVVANDIKRMMVVQLYELPSFAKDHSIGSNIRCTEVVANLVQRKNMSVNIAFTMNVHVIIVISHAHVNMAIIRIWDEGRYHSHQFADFNKLIQVIHRQLPIIGLDGRRFRLCVRSIHFGNLIPSVCCRKMSHGSTGWSILSGKSRGC